MKISIFGSTLQAAVFAGVFAESGHHVHWCPQFSETQSESQDVQIPEYQDQNVNQLLEKQLKAGRLILKHNLTDQFEHEVCLLSYASTELVLAERVINEIVHKNIIPQLVINGSTLGLNMTQQLSQHLSQSKWAYLPDNIQEGNALTSVLSLKRLIVGVDDESVKQLIIELFRPQFPAKHQYLFMPILDAEFTKLSISGMLATRISFMNDLANVSEKLGIDIQNVQQGLASDSRIGASYLSAGAGFGGENFSHDILTLSNTVNATGVKSRLLDQVWEINEQQKEILFRKLWNIFKGDLKNKKIAIWGASFKENTASIQNSSIHPLLEALWAQGAIVYLHDPEALHEVNALYGARADLILCSDQYQVIQQADALCLLTAWKQYWSPDFQYLKQQMNRPLILDGRNIYDPAYVKSQGFEYQGVGRA